MTSCRVSRLLVVSCVAAISCRAQNWISIGVKGGVPLTDAFADRSVQQAIGIRIPFGPPQTFSQTTRFSNGSRNFILGPTLELRLPFGVAVEADALYRPMEFQIQIKQTIPPFLVTRTTLMDRGDVWEFPILAKYRLPLPRLKPYLAGGPSFRATAASLPKQMSGTGIAAAIGIETRIGHLRLAPEVRYTHWGADSAYPSPNHVTSYQNQVEFLMGLATGATGSGASGTTSPSAAGWRKHLAVGVKGGWPFSNAFIQDSYSRITFPPILCGGFGPNPIACPIADATVETHRASHGYLIGPSVEFLFPLHLSIEGDALYGPLSLATPASQGPVIQTYASWSFPVVGKYRFHLPFAKPYLEAGPTFRTASLSVESGGDRGCRRRGNRLEVPSRTRGAFRPLGRRCAGCHDILRLPKEPGTILAGSVLLARRLVLHAQNPSPDLPVYT